MSDKEELPQLGQKLPPQAAARVEKQLGGAIETAKAARLTDEQAKDARKRAEEAVDPEDRKKIEEEARKLEKTARSQLRVARRLESGAWQGAGAGIGIGAATGLGLGTVVGAILGGVTAIPTSALGGLVGAGTGAIHGPWVKLGGDGFGSKETDHSGTQNRNATAGTQHQNNNDGGKAETKEEEIPGPKMQTQGRRRPKKLDRRSLNREHSATQTSNTGCQEKQAQNGSLGNPDEVEDSGTTAASPFATPTSPNLTSAETSQSSQEYKAYSMQMLGAAGHVFTRTQQQDAAQKNGSKETTSSTCEDLEALRSPVHQGQQTRKPYAGPENSTAAPEESSAQSKSKKRPRKLDRRSQNPPRNDVEGIV
ncbi:MAG: hypothetical protein M1820_004081 [Bogoriella megaspora]|nr:MAG: hypothetical protein M1820_004081 [Bogoriella megaspora]